MKQQLLEKGDIQDFWPNKPLRQTGHANEVRTHLPSLAVRRQDRTPVFPMPGNHFDVGNMAGRPWRESLSLPW
jgi:hypothetical protein